MKTVELTPHIRFNVPADWAELSANDGTVRLLTADGATFFVRAGEFRKPAHPGTGLGPTSEQMVSIQVCEYGVSPSVLADGRAFATHSIPIGEPGQEKECRVWHIVNQVAAWHHETLLCTYEPAADGKIDQATIAMLDKEIRSCRFDRALSAAPTSAADKRAESKPWWKFW